MLFFAQAMLPDGWARDVRVTVADGRIAAVTQGAAPAAGDARHAVGLPGMPNLHSHAFQRGMAGLSEVRGPQGDTFWTWREVMYRFLARMTPDDVEAVAVQAYVEMLESGFTRVGEFHYLHHDADGRPYADVAELAQRIAAAAAQAGIRLTLLPSFYAHGGFGGAAPAPGQRRFLCDLDLFARLLEASAHAVAGLPGAVLGVAPHSLRAVSPAELAAAAAMLPDAPVHIHAAEQVREVADCLAWSGARPVQWLLDHAPVNERWCVIHATHMLPEETALLAATGAVAGLCPITEASLGDGVFDGPGWAAAGGGYGIGTDSNVLIDAAGELRQLEYAQRLALRARNVMAGHEGRSTGGTLFRAALAGGGAALGAAEPALRAGAPADIVALDAAAPSLLRRGGDALLDGWMFATPRPAVAAVWVDGRQVVADGRHVAAERVRRRYADCIGHLVADRRA
jgi:formiminoglutamate deiminase